jgi:hypothetical protein
MQILNVLLVFLCGRVVGRLTGGRVWWPVAVTLLLVFPGFAGAINLGQNPVVSLALLLLGWWQVARGRPVAGGVLWGFLAFKPVWAASFFLVPLLTRRWRLAGAMLLTGLALAALTLPFVGWRAWRDWLEVGRMGSASYAEAENWVNLSRDLQGIPRRWLLTFADGWATDAGRPLPTRLGLGLWLGVLAVTVLVAFLRRLGPAALAGPPAAFVLLGAWLSCYHFMYYDVLLTALPVCLLFTEPGRYLKVSFWPAPAEPLHPELLAYYRPRLEDPTPPPAPLLPGGGRLHWVRNPLPPTVLVLMIGLTYLGSLLDPTYHFPPFDTFCLLVLWGWCGWRWLRDGS